MLPCQPPRHRRFGTLLSENSPEQKLTVSTKKGQRSSRPLYTVSFAAGVRPLGLQLEPFHGRQGCRVQGFVDKGADNPGPARAKNCIKAGDVVVAVNGQQITSYDQAIALLKDARRVRDIVLQAASHHISSSPPRSSQQQDREAPSTATKPSLPGTLRKTLRSDLQKDGARPDNVVSPSFGSPPVVAPPIPKDSSPRELSPAMDVSLIMSADDLVLLSQSVVRRPRRPSVSSPYMTTQASDDPLEESLVMPVEEMIANDFSGHGTSSRQRSPAAREIAHVDDEAHSLHRLQRELQQAKETLADQSTYWQESSTTDEATQRQWQDEKKTLQQELLEWKARAATLDREKEHAHTEHQQALQQSHAQSHELNEQLIQRQEVVDQARLQRDGATRTVEQKTQIVNELSRKIELERRQASELQQRLQVSLETVEQCNTLIEVSRKEIDKWKSQCQAIKTDAATGRLQVEGRLREEIELYKAEVQGHKDKSGELDKELGQSRKLNTDLLKQTEHLQRAIDMSDQRCCDVETQLERQTSETETARQTIENLQEGFMQSKAEEANALVESRLATTRLEITELQRSLEEADSRNKLLIREKREVSEASVVVRDKLSRTQDQLMEVQAELSEKEARRSSLEVCLDDITVKLDQRTKELEATQQVVLSLENRYSDLSKAPPLPLEDSSTATLASDLIATQAELGASKNQNTELERLLRSMRRSLTDSERRVTASREQVEVERQALKDFKAQAKASEDEVQLRVETLLNEIRSFRSQLSTSEEERKQTERRATRLEKEFDVARIDMSASLESRQEILNKIQTERSSLIERLSSQKKETLDLSERLRVSKSEHESTRREMSTLRRSHVGQIQTIKHECEGKVNTLSEILKKKDQDLRLMNKCKDELRIARDELAQTEKSCQRSREECDLLSTLLDEVRDECTSKIDDLIEAHLSELRRLGDAKEEIQSQSDATRQKLDSTTQQLYAAEEAVLISRMEQEKLRVEKTSIAVKLQRVLDELSEKSTELDQAILSKEASFDECDAFSGLSRQDIQDRCLSLATEIEGMQVRLEESHDALAKQKEHNRSLQERWTELSEETGLLANSNRQLEDRLTLGKKSQEEAQNALSAERSNVKRLNEALHLTRSQLMNSENGSGDLTSKLKSLQDELDKTKSSANQSIYDLKCHLATAEAELDESARLRLRSTHETAANNTLVVELKEHMVVLEKRLAEAVEGRDCLQEQYDEVSAQNVGSKQELGAIQEAFLQKIADLESRCDHLQGAMSGLEIDLAVKTAEITERLEKEDRLSDSVEELRREYATLACRKDEVLAALTEAVQQGKSYKETIRSLEGQLLDSERETTLLSSQMEGFRGTILKLEETSATSIHLRSKQLQESEAKCSSLTKEQEALVREIESLRDEQRDSRRKLTEQERMVVSLENRVGSLSDALARTKDDYEKATNNKKSISSSTQALERALESKHMEVDNLRARLQVLEATISRMKSDRALLEDVSSRAEQRVAASCDLEDEIFRLQSKLHSQESKLVSLSKVHKSQQQVLSLSQSLEGQLISFVEDALHCAGDTIFELASQSLHIQEIHTTLFGEKDSLVSDELNRHAVQSLQESISNLIESIPRAKSILEEKHEQLETWKQRRSRRVPDLSYSTPDAKAKTKPESPSVLQALDKMKEALNDELLSPHKERPAGSQTVDAEYLSRVVRALENQIDGLLDDLQSANDALRAKDQLFADFEQLVAHHESERDNLERKLEQAKQSICESDANGNQLLQHSSTEGKAATAAQMLANFFESRELCLKAGALRQWSIASTSSRVAAQQNRTADALAFELETTREKISILKRHLKKSRRGKGHRHSDLDSINEDNVAAEEGYQTT